LTSPVVSEGAPIKAEQVFNKFGCTGKNVSPVLSWSGAPAGAKSFALTIFDPDAPTGSGFWHWVVANIPANVTSLPMNAGDLRGKNLPKGAVQVRNDYGALGYGGPCPPKGDTHHYVFTVFAVDVDKLPVDAQWTPAFVGFNLISTHWRKRR
jgi:Raf kinase inhibitor-like YbhB/YbcL family protein